MKYAFFLIFFLFQYTLMSQILFSVELQEDNKTYLVKIKPTTSYSGRKNITNSAQCSFVVPTGGFQIANIQNHHGLWKNDNTIINPPSNPGKDYFVFNLNGHITNLQYKKDEEIVLFSFENSGKNTGKLDFVSAQDVAALKSKNLNLGNYISVFGAGLRNAFEGTYNKSTSNTVITDATEEAEEEVEEYEEGPEQEQTYVLGGVSSDVFEFSTFLKDQLVNLEWIAGQTNITKQFIIEKSLDGINFKAIKVINDLSDHHFKELDLSPDYGTNYYRIKQEFNTGDFRYSVIKEEKYYLDAESINMYPNPVKDHFWLRIGHFVELEGKVHIFNVSGNEMAQQKLEKTNKAIKFETSTFPNGLYFLIIDADNKKMIERQFIIENAK